MRLEFKGADLFYGLIIHYFLYTTIVHTILYV